MNTAIFLQSYLNDLLREHHVLPINVDLVQDNAKGIGKDSSLTRKYLLQHQIVQDDDILMLSDVDLDDLDDEDDNQFGGEIHSRSGLSTADTSKNNNSDARIPPRWMKHQQQNPTNPDPPIRQQKDQRTATNSSNRRFHGKRNNKMKSHTKNGSGSSSTSLEGQHFVRKAIHRSISEGGSTKDKLRQRAKELLLATAGMASKISSSKNERPGILRRNSWSNDNLSKNGTRHWEESSDSQLTIPIRRTSDHGDELVNESWDHKHTSLEFAFYHEDNNIKDVRLRVPTRQNTLISDDDEDDDIISDEDNDDNGKLSVGKQYYHSPHHHHHHDRNNNYGNQTIAASHIKEAMDIAASLVK